MLSMSAVMNRLQEALPNARLIWHHEGKDAACIIATLAEEEHYVGVSLVTPGLDEDGLALSVYNALATHPI